MKDEEMAEERAAKFTEINYNEPDNYGTEKEIGYQAYYCGFLAGLKAGRPQWHDIKDTEPSKEQLGKQLLIRMESVIGDTDYDYLVYKYAGESITDVPDVIAWCEIPTFDKE